METSKNKLGADHPSTLTSMANLASTFWNQGRWEEAEKLEVLKELRGTRCPITTRWGREKFKYTKYIDDETEDKPSGDHLLQLERMVGAPFLPISRHQRLLASTRLH